jgi:cobalamin biosynthesis Mg chelatase CobN
VAAAKPVDSAAAAKPKSGVLPIVLILGALAIVAIVLIIVFAR